MENEYSGKIIDLQSDDAGIYRDHIIHGLQKVPTGHVKVYGPSEAEMKMELESINKAKASNTLESILGLADLAIY
jgi:hypothetical protein